MIKRIGGQNVLIITRSRYQMQPQSIVDSCFYREQESIDLVLVERSVFDDVTMDPVMFSRITKNLKDMGSIDVF